jgi:hypothetical protein
MRPTEPRNDRGGNIRRATICRRDPCPTSATGGKLKSGRVNPDRICPTRLHWAGRPRPVRRQRRRPSLGRSSPTSRPSTSSWLIHVSTSSQPIQARASRIHRYTNERPRAFPLANRGSRPAVASSGRRNPATGASSRTSACDLSRVTRNVRPCRRGRGPVDVRASTQAASGC